jgi:hypothetical protein
MRTARRNASRGQFLDTHREQPPYEDAPSRSYGCAGYPGTGEPYTGTPSEAEEPPVCLWTRVRVDPSRLDGRAQPFRVPRRSWRPRAVAGMRDACHCIGSTTLGTRYKTTTIETVTRTRSRVSTLDRLTRHSASATGLRGAGDADCAGMPIMP